MFLTITMNPSVDISYQIKKLIIDDINRVDYVSKTAGGKGINVARVIKQLGYPVMATGILGGTIGQFIMNQLDESSIQHDFYLVNKESRNCIAIIHEGNQTELLEPGPTISPEEETGFLSHLKNLLDRTDMKVVTISGSLPKGVAKTNYEKIIALANSKGLKVLLDTSGEPLNAVLSGEKKPYLIKPNLNELCQLEEYILTGDLTELKNVLSQNKYDGIHYIVVSMGCNGAFAKVEGDFYKVSIPRIPVVNPVGSGDATIAGFAVAIAQGKNVTDVLKLGMTTGMLNAMEKRTGFINRSELGKLFTKVSVRKY